MKHHFAGVVKAQVRGAAHGLPCHTVKALEAKAKIPDQKAFTTLRHTAGDNEMRLLQRLEHVHKDALHLGHTFDLVEGVFEKGVGSIQVFEPGHIGELELFIKRHQFVHRQLHLGGRRVHAFSLTMRLTSGR